MNDNMNFAINDNWFSLNEKMNEVESGFDSIMHDVMNLGTALGLKTEVWINPNYAH